MSKRPKILYAIQGTGNGHVARAREIIPILQKFGDLDIVLSGDQSEVDLPIAPKFRSKGLTFIYNRHGGVSYLKTLLKNNLLKIAGELWRFPVKDYDIIINDFEFITAWACKLKRKECIGMGHQASFRSSKTPRPLKKEWIGEAILKYYAPCSRAIGFHFDHFDHFVEKPVIRREIRNKKPRNKGHYTVYLPAFGDNSIAEFLLQIPDIQWEVFSKSTQTEYSKGNVTFFPISNEGFIQSFISCEGVFTSAGFETPAEAIFLGKKVMVIPIMAQYEQYCNAAALQAMGLPVIYKLDSQGLAWLKNWILYQKPLNIHYPDRAESIIREHIIEPFLKKNPHLKLIYN